MSMVGSRQPISLKSVLALKSREQRKVRVRCYDWSMVEAALLDSHDWAASMITIKDSVLLNDNGSARPLIFRKRFFLPSNRTIKMARLYATSHGVYFARLNNKSTGDECMAPGWQSYNKRLHYQVHDVGSLLLPGVENVLLLDVGPGWFASALSWVCRRFVYGTELGILAQLEVQFDGTDEPFIVCTDSSWTATTSAILSSEIYNGEVYNQQRAIEIGRAHDELSLVTWSETRVSNIAVAPLTSPNGPPVRVTERLRPKSFSKSASGKTIIDFGQNIAGRLCIRRLLKPAGHKVTFRHAEVVENDELGTGPLRTAEAKDTVICAGTVLTDWHPNFTFHGFRFVEVSGWSEHDAETPLTKDSVVAEVMHSDMRRTGWFSCSNDEVNQLHKNTVWSMRGNFLSVPTECPSRDERLGWTGDLNLFAPTATFLYDTGGILGDWLQDLYADQMDNHKNWKQGMVPLYVPNCLTGLGPEDDGWHHMQNGVWGDAAVMVPFQLYMMTKDINILSRQYDSMKQYLEKGVRRGEDGLWDPYQWQFGDWLDPSAPPNNSGRGRTDGTFVADCFLIESTERMAFIAEELQKSDDFSDFSAAHSQLLMAFQAKYVTPAGLLAPDTPTAHALAIAFDLLPSDERSHFVASEQATAARLSRALRSDDFCISTGFVGTAFLLPSLTKSYQDTLAYQMLLSRSTPSLLYPVRMGATTIWERWDSLKPDGHINEASMTSFNHHALGSVTSWLHESVGGIKADRPGWKNILIEPCVNRMLSYAEIIYESVYGRIECRWKLDGNTFSMDVTVPPNAHACIVLPEVRDKRAQGLEVDGYWVGSGRYHFKSEYTRADHPVEPILPPWGRSSF
ncbi:alfa-L-rhamnosidase [Fonsecaea pedrosoi]|nr:alfa-L-rhamnosidase [Fonsecaea pedrosoi]